MAKKQTVNPYEVELLDLWNEVGGQMVIEYHTAKIKPAKEDLQQIRDKGFKTDVVTVIIAEIAARCGQDETIAFIEKAEAAGAAPSVTFEAAEGEALNIKSREENPMVDMMVQAVSNQQ